MKITQFTKLAGVVFLVVGILGFVPGLLHEPHAHDPSLAVDEGYGRLFGLFPVNVLHNIVHLAFAVWAFIAARSVIQSIRYCKITSVLYGGLAILGFIPGLRTLFGLVPLHSHDIWLHIVLAVSIGYFGYRRESVATRLSPHG